MKVLVLGAGVVGTTSAWYLAQAGHEVTLVERCDEAAMETSFANGGQVSPCHAEPWANPSVLPKVMKWLGREDAPLLFRWGRWDPALWQWCLRFLVNCTPRHTAINTERTLRVALYSRSCLQDLRRDTGIQYDQKTLGILHVYRDRREFDHACQAAEMMGRWGLRRQVTSADDCAIVEPALSETKHQLAGGIFTPDDESGDAHKFTQSLAALAADHGVTFRYGVTVQGLTGDGDRVTGVHTDQGDITADAVVVAMGSYSPQLVQPLGLRLPLVPAKGYSITLAAGNGAPHVSITDDEHKIVFSRLGDRLRVAGTAEMTGYDTTLTPARWQVVRRQAMSLFPNGGDYDNAEPWTGLRPTTPDSVPILGPTRIRNLYLNTGHGTLGWTMSCGSARVIADLVSGRKPEIDTDGLSLARFGG